MSTFRVLAVFEVCGTGTRAAPAHGLPVGDDVLAPFWGEGLDLGYSDGRTLTVSAVSAAVGPDAAAADVVARSIGAWCAACGGGPGLTLSPASVRVLPQMQPEISA